VSLEKIIADFKAEFPGWWWSVGECQLSCDATVGPTTVAPDSWLLDLWEFDAGFDGDIPQPSTVEAALLNAIERARAARSSALARKLGAMA
jgi:hypothetical protein